VSSPAVPLSLAPARKRWGEVLIKGLLAGCALVSVATTIGIVIALFLPAFEFFQVVSFRDYITGTEWAPLFLQASFGLGSAIFLSEYARPRVRASLKPALELLAGIPTVVYGYFALTWVTPHLKDLGLGVGVFNALSAGLVMGVMIIPTVASLSEDAMSAVPRDLRYGAYALGSSKLQVSTRIVVPAAISGIVAAFVLGISRAIGETMIVLLAAGQQPNLSFDPREAVETMSAFIAATGAGDVPTGSTEYKTIFAVGATLFVMTLLLNAVSIRLVRKYREVYE
jgi:phosphate transport system permease protein